MNGIQELEFSIRAGYGFFYCQTEEIERTVDLIKNTFPNNPIKVWDFEFNQDPDQVIEELDDQNCEPGTIMIAKNWHWFLKDEFDKPEKRLVTFVLNRFELWTTEQFRRSLIIIGSDPFDTAIPKEIQREAVHITFSLPDESEISERLEYVIYSAKDNPKFKMPTEAEKALLVEAAKGMTKREVENAFTYSIVKTRGRLDPVIVSERKAKEVEKTAGLKIGKYDQDINELKGYDNIKKFVLGTISSPLSKGVMLLGPPGTGKTTFARSIGNAAKRIVFELEMAELFGGLVGDTEKLVRTAINVIIANSPCVLFVDEIEKGLAGAAGGINSVSTDGGTTRRAMAQFLKFLSDRPQGIYVIATCNDISSLDPEWIRAGRWDSAPWFLDLRSTSVRLEIWKHYTNKYGIKHSEELVDDKWTGAEIESCCRIAKMMSIDVKEAANYIVPVANTMGDKISALRSWANGKTIPADKVISMAKKRGIKI